MTIELTPEQSEVLRETKRIDDIDEFKTLLAAAQPEMGRIIREVFAPSQGLDATLTELRDLLLTVNKYREPLEQVRYDEVRRARLRDAIRLLATAQLWFGEKTRTGEYRPKPVKDVIEASRPWRARLSAIGGHAFVFEPDLAAQFADVNSTGTIEEEKQDLATLNDLIDQHRERLTEFGLTEELIQRGKTLQEQAEGRDLIGVLGLRSYNEAQALRNRVLTYAILLGREARAAGINACWEDETARGRFEAASFRNALRRLRARRRGQGPNDGSEPNTDEPPPTDEQNVEEPTEGPPEPTENPE